MALLEIKNLTKSFGTTRVLKGINFDMESGKVLSIIGSSGSGKTTLLRCLNFLETADGGSILVDGKPVYDAEDPSLLSPKAIRHNRISFGLVFQSFNLFPQYSVLRNLTLAAMMKAKEENPDFSKNKKEIAASMDKRAIELLDRIGLKDKKDNYPCELSGGQQQRVAIARALMLTPRILCFDEPTSALDPELTGEVLKVIRELASQNTTMIIVTHEINFAKDVSDEIIFMDNGVIAEQGTPNQVIVNPTNERTRQFLSNFR